MARADETLSILAVGEMVMKRVFGLEGDTLEWRCSMLMLDLSLSNMYGGIYLLIPFLPWNQTTSPR